MEGLATARVISRAFSGTLLGYLRVVQEFVAAVMIPITKERRLDGQTAAGRHWCSLYNLVY